MKSTPMSCAALAATAIGGPGQALPVSNSSLHEREASAVRRIEWCDVTGAISGFDATVLRREMERLQRDVRAMLAAGGPDWRERIELNSRLSRLERNIALACRPLPHRPEHPRLRLQRD